MSRLPLLLLLLAGPASAGPLTLNSRVLVAGTTRSATPVRADHAAPGDAVVVELAYRNTGTAPLADLVLANPIPAGLRYRGPVAGSPEPEVSTDGRRFAPLGRLAVALPGGSTRAATADDVAQVRWRLPAPLAPGAGGALSFLAGVR